MSVFDTLTSLKMQGAIRVLIYGPPKIGKTTLASEFPNPVFLQLEDGQNSTTETTGWGRESLQNYDDLRAKLQGLYEEAHDFKTVVIDSASALQWLVWAETCRRGDEKYPKGVDTIEKFGYGKGYKYASYIWQELLDDLNLLRLHRNMHVVLIGHSKILKFDNPEGASFDRYEIDVHEIASKILEREMDAILLVKQDISIKEEDQGFNKTRGIAQGLNRFIFACARPAFIAGNRIGLPEKLNFVAGKGFAAIEPFLPAQPVSQTTDQAAE